MLTINKDQKLDYVSIDDLTSVIDQFIKLYPTADVIDTGYECHGRYYQLHAHVIVCIGNRLCYKKFRLYNGMRVHYELCSIDCIYDMLRCLDYIHKNDWEDEYVISQILDCNYYRYNYGF